jgi:integrase
MTVTRYLATLKRAARWGAKSQRVKLEVCQLIELANVPKGWGRRSKKVLAADPALVAKVLPFLTPPVRAIAELQILTGSRQGGLIRLRPRDIYRTGKQELPGLGVVDLDVAGVWVGIPVSHKKEWRDKPRWVVLGPRAQAVIEPFLQGDPESYCFRPEESVRALRERQRQDRASRGGGSGGNRKPRVSQPKSKPREHYTTAGYRQAIRRACVRAGVAVINPHQIRHLFAAQIRDSHGIEDAQAMLGHDSPDMTKHYAKRSFERAARVARESG